MSKTFAIRSGLAVLGGVLVILAMTAVAVAHDPVFLTDEQTTPETGPYFPDGAISWALYGSFPEATETRGFEFDLRDGEDLYMSLLIPNLEPELSLTVEQLPFMEVFLPDGEVIMVEPTFGEVFDEAFSGTSYVTLWEEQQPAVGGRHQVVVHSRAPARFSVAVGQREEFGTPADRTVDRPSGFTEFAAPLNAWWNTPPGEEPAAPSDGEEITVDIEAAEEALEELAEQELAATSTTAATIESNSDASSALPGTGDTDDGGGAGWVIPAVLGVVLIGAGAVFMRRRSDA